MDAESELQLYNHVEFLTTTKNPQRLCSKSDLQKQPNLKRNQQKKKGKKQIKSSSVPGKNSVTKPKKSGNVGRISYQLTADELLFFPKSYDPTPIRQIQTDPNDLHRKKHYIEKINTQTSEEKREFRAKRDARYLHESEPKNNEDERVMCMDHLVGRCQSDDCGRWHQMRRPRLLGACKFYLSGVCKNDSCQYMHEEFPCRYYHLDLAHPKLAENEACRFKHGGPLPQQLRQYFRKQIEIWVSKIANNKPHQLDNMLMNFLNKFDVKQSKLEAEYAIVKRTDKSSTSSSNDCFSLENILSPNQLKRLAEKNVTSISQINQISIQELNDLGLSIDDIYKITRNTCDESYQMPPNDSHQITKIQTESNFEAELLMLNSPESDDTSFEGFAEIEMKDAAEILQKRQIESHIEAELMHTDDDLEENQNKIEKITLQPEHTQADDSDDSDNEFNLVINEDNS